MHASTKNRAERRDIHAEITAKLIAGIEADPGRPSMPWRRSAAACGRRCDWQRGAPQSPASRKPFSP